MPRRVCPFLALCCLAVASPAQQSLARQIAALTSEPAVARDHWGVMVTALDGTPIYGLNQAQLFQPASNAKLFTTSAAMALLSGDVRFKAFETRVIAHGTLSTPQTLEGDLYLVGGGDANLSARTLPYLPSSEQLKGTKPPLDPLHRLAELADQVAATGLKSISGDIVGDDTLYRYEPYPQDWAIDDAVWGYGAPISALTINDNQIVLTITAGKASGDPATLAFSPELPYYTVDGHISTGTARSANSVHIERSIGSKTLRIYGSIAVDAPQDAEEIAIDDPAEYAAIALKQMLTERGIAIIGAARSRHLPSHERRGFLEQTREPIALSLGVGGGCGDCGRPDLEAHETVLTTYRSAPFTQDIVVTNKTSQNLHAEMLLEDLGKSWTGTASLAQGARVVRQFLLNAGLAPDDFVFFDGSGLSGHDLVTPRATAKLLAYATTQPWFTSWKSSLPVGGVDGSLEHRFTAAPLRGHVFAKTGTLGEARALSGYLEAASGRTVIFSIMVGNHLPGTSADRDVMDRIVAAIAASN